MRDRRAAPAHPGPLPAAGGTAHRDAVRDGRPRQRLDRCRRLRRSGLVASWARCAYRSSTSPTTRTPWPAAVDRTRSAPGRRRDRRYDYLLYGRRDLDGPCSTPSGPTYPRALIAGFGSDMAVLKGVGHPRKLTDAWGLAKAQGWQGVGHTRMATESAVTPAGCHPYAVGPEQCMVHNGSFANHATIRRELRAAGVEFDSENDTEVGARFIAKQLADGSRRRDGAQGTVRDVRRLLHAAGVRIAIRSPWSATPSPASRP